ncbi:NACHT, LRR and PYD domains-containing protein 1 homolog isoform X1 [Cyprinus carpio]|uniref:NACHT, LRR and PYD domains-containing protein 1 homolog isoform X1 n=1 Tax=Cyprinus carpio TaxID=7962 RepID=A0A9Q9WJV0_CYPCA|nr:NACHT, LRR and PYD domains-containing protein 1 homolog isoform X1 [Cyprinus carpio]
MNAEKVERNIIETQQNLNKEIRKINEGRQALYQEHIDRTILNSLELLNTLDQDVAEASRLQHPQSEMIEKDVSSSEGQHECSETGLRWRSDTDVSLEYQFVEWTSLSKDILKKYTPCGPLIDITATSGTLEEIQLPHFVCVDSISSSDDAVKALYVKDGTVSLERCELSGLHAKFLNPTAALFGVVAVQGHLPLKYHCETLIYRNRKAPLNLHVYLIVKDQKLKKYVEEKEKNNMEIVKPTPDEGLTMDDSYTLKTSCESKIKPPSLKLTPGKTNFFDLHIQDAKECLELSIETKEGHKIWDVNIKSEEFNTNSSASDWRLKTINRSVLILQWWRQLITAIELSAGGPLKTSLQRSRSHQSSETDTAQKKGRCKKGEGAEFVEKHRTELISRVSLVEPIADDMKPLIGEEKYQIILNSGTRRK